MPTIIQKTAITSEQAYNICQISIPCVCVFVFIANHTVIIICPSTQVMKLVLTLELEFISVIRYYLAVLRLKGA